jgi:hypothetical protein
MAFKLITIGSVAGARGFVSNEDKVQAIKRVALGGESPGAVVGGFYEAQDKPCPKMPSVVLRLWHKQVAAAIARGDRWIIKCATEAGILQETADDVAEVEQKKSDSALDRLNSETAEVEVAEVEKKKNGKHRK